MCVSFCSFFAAVLSIVRRLLLFFRLFCVFFLARQPKNILSFLCIWELSAYPYYMAANKYCYSFRLYYKMSRRTHGKRVFNHSVFCVSDKTSFSLGFGYLQCGFLRCFFLVWKLFAKIRWQKLLWIYGVFFSGILCNGTICYPRIAQKLNDKNLVCVFYGTNNKV